MLHSEVYWNPLKWFFTTKNEFIVELGIHSQFLNLDFPLATKHFLKILGQDIVAITKLRFHFSHLQVLVYFLFIFICFWFQLIFHYPAICTCYTSQVYLSSVTLHTSFLPTSLFSVMQFLQPGTVFFARLNSFHYSSTYSISTFSLGNFLQLL